MPIPLPGLEAPILVTYVTVPFEVSAAPCRSGLCSLAGRALNLNVNF